MQTCHEHMLATRLPDKTSKGARQQRWMFLQWNTMIFKKKASFRAHTSKAFESKKKQCLRHRQKVIPCTHVQRGAGHSVHTRSYERLVGQSLRNFTHLNFRSLICMPSNTNIHSTKTTRWINIAFNIVTTCHYASDVFWGDNCCKCRTSCIISLISIVYVAICGYIDLPVVAIFPSCPWIRGETPNSIFLSI